VLTLSVLCLLLVLSTQTRGQAARPKHSPKCRNMAEWGHKCAPSLYDRLVVNGETPDGFSAKRLYPGLSVADAVARCKRLAVERCDAGQEGKTGAALSVQPTETEGH
jgi:hypothetical protein